MCNVYAKIKCYRYVYFPVFCIFKTSSVIKYAFYCSHWVPLIAPLRKPTPVNSYLAPQCNISQHQLVDKRVNQNCSGNSDSTAQIYCSIKEINSAAVEIYCALVLRTENESPGHHEPLEAPSSLRFGAIEAQGLPVAGSGLSAPN
jgi:hypothetical protein